jgi:hypothetical protein
MILSNNESTLAANAAFPISMNLAASSRSGFLSILKIGNKKLTLNFLVKVTNDAIFANSVR